MPMTGSERGGSRGRSVAKMINLIPHWSLSSNTDSYSKDYHEIQECFLAIGNKFFLIINMCQMISPKYLCLYNTFKL